MEKLRGCKERGIEIQVGEGETRRILDSKIDVLLNTKTEVAIGAEVSVLELKLAHLQSLLEDLSSLLSTDCNVNSDLLIPTDTEGSDGVAGWGWM